ncbi:MAG: DUF763 domain-containing protein [Euryarchaeota archaeon]|nr:DUF763 domain-containing protein [Euryarchaeota archaeon]
MRKYVDLPLHGGKAPYWLVKRMKGLAAEIFRIMVTDFGTEETLKRIADPYWFQALSCVLGFDWHSSGTTTVTCGVLNDILSTQLGMQAAGGKGKGKRTLQEIREKSESLGLSENKMKVIRYASRMTAKVDSSCIQDFYPIYHHMIFFDEKGNWSVVQQGMNTKKGFARRYQWDATADFIDEPQNKVSGVREKDVLNLVDKKSEEARKMDLDLVRSDIRRVKSYIQRLSVSKNQETLDPWAGEKQDRYTTLDPLYTLPKRVNWPALKRAYEYNPSGFEELLSLKGIGGATLRGLTMVSELIYGEEPSWKDPVRYSFAYGGKDGVPYPVNRKAMDSSIEFLRTVMDNVEGKDKKKALKRLKGFGVRKK